MFVSIKRNNHRTIYAYVAVDHKRVKISKKIIEILILIKSNEKN